MPDGQLTLHRSDTSAVGQQRYLFPRVARLCIEIPGFLHDVVYCLRICDPQAILLHIRTSRFSQEFERGSGARSIKRDTYPERTIPADDVPELLEKPLIRCSSLSGLEIPLVS